MDRKSSPSSVATPARLLVAVMVDIVETFFREIVAGAAQYGREVGDWQLQVVRHPAEWAAAGRDWHGLIACLNDERVAAVAQSSGVPTVAVGSIGIDPPEPGIVRVDTDNEQVAAMAFEHLRERGLATFGYYGALPTAGTRWSVVRGDRFGASVAAAGYPCARLTGCDTDAESPAARQELADWLTGLPKPVGIMACSDLHGRLVLEACRAAGLRVPYDVAVVGVDNDELECELAVPPLTSIPQAARRIGHEAARLLDHLVSPERFSGQAAAVAVPRLTLIPPASIIPRASTETFVVADPVIARVIEAVREQACRGLTIADLVAISGLPRWKLEKQFKQAVGHSIHDDIVRVRLSEARRLIRTTDLPLKVVSNRSGFHSVAYMTTIFRRRFGTTPARFRRVEQGGVVRAPDTDDEGQE
jgi:LacI family transcriptional regulator